MGREVLKVLVLGASGLLGNAVFRVLNQSQNLDVNGTIRDDSVRQYFTSKLARKLTCVQDLSNTKELNELLIKLCPDVVINCVSVGRPAPKNPAKMFSILSTFPQRLAYLCRNKRTYLIQVSSDGVFLGDRGSYSELDLPDANDIYGTAKFLGEVSNQNAITLRTSIIGPELYGKAATLEWLLSQSGQCSGYVNSFFSGLTTIEFARLLRDIVIPQKNIHGIFHVASQSISKFDLLELIAYRYELDIELIRDATVVVDRTLDGSKFAKLTGYVAPTWSDMIKSMHEFNYGLR